jgi:hypothetical protein
MKDRLVTSSKIEFRKSCIQGWGVFAKEDINTNEILEEIPILFIPDDEIAQKSSIFTIYKFAFPNSKNGVVPMGFGCYYNHSNTPNAYWETDEENNIFIFTTKEFIKKDEEITTYYGSFQPLGNDSIFAIENEYEIPNYVKLHISVDGITYHYVVLTTPNENNNYLKDRINNYIAVRCESTWAIEIKTKNTNLLSNLILATGQSAKFIFNGEKWILTDEK